MAYQFLQLHKDNRVLTIRLNRPPLNPLSGEFGLELFSAFTEVGKMDDVSVVVITSALEEAFIAGADIKQIAAMSPGDSEVFSRLLQNANNLLTEMRQIVIAAINGHALGGGCELALACDFRFMKEGSGRIGMPEAGLGILPGGGATQRLPRLIGLSRALDILLRGRSLEPEEALAIGLVDRVIPAANFMDEVMTFARQLAAVPGKTLGNIKAAVMKGIDLPLQEALAVERQYGLETFQTRDAREGLSAFIEKREPNFIHD